MKSTIEHNVLSEILDLARKVLQPFPALSFTERQTIINKSNVFETLPETIAKKKLDQIDSFKAILLGNHPIFQSDQFLSITEYHPLDTSLYSAFHKLPVDSPESNVHGNNYVYTRTNLRNGILFTYYDKETKSFIPVTFNTNPPINLVAPDPLYINGNIANAIKRMLLLFHHISREHNFVNFPLIFKGIPKDIAKTINNDIQSYLLKIEKDISTITAEMNYPALSYNINSLQKMVRTRSAQFKGKKPKVINAVRKIDPLVTCEDWNFDHKIAKLLARKWTLSKIARLERRGITGIDANYLINTIYQAISINPPGKQNVDYFSVVIRCRARYRNIARGEILGIVIASRNNNEVAGLNAVVVPVQKSIRDMGYYSVYKLVERMSKFNVKSYWHGPKELQSDESAIIEFMGIPSNTDKKYCLKFNTGKGYAFRIKNEHFNGYTH